MRKIAIVTDSSCAIPPDITARLENMGGFAVVPLNVEIEGEKTDASKEESDQIAYAHAVGLKIQTSSPALGDFSTVYRELLAEGFTSILSIHLSSELSSTYDIARISAQEFGGIVRVLDSRTVAMALGWAVLKAYDLAEKIEDGRVLAETVLEICENTQFYFYVPTLDALKRGGRIHPALARVGQMLQIRPVATVDEGKLVYLERPRTKEQAQKLLAEHYFEESRRRNSAMFWGENEYTPRPDGSLVATHYCGNHSELIQWLNQENLPQDSLVSPLPAVLSAHTGLGVIAVVIY